MNEQLLKGSTPLADGTLIYFDPEDEETKKLLDRRSELQNELDRIDTRLVNKQLQVELLSKFKKDTWYRYSEGDVYHTYFKIKPDDFIRDGSVWLHTVFTEKTLRISSSFTIEELVLMSTELFQPDHEKDFHEVDKETIDGILERIKNYAEGLKNA